MIRPILSAFLMVLAALSVPAQEVPMEELLFPEDLPVVTASKTLIKAKESPAIISVITDEMIRQRGYETVAEALQSVPGLSVWRDQLISSVGVRGINSVRGWNQTLKIMIDSQPVALRYSSINFLDEELIPIRAIKRIEVIRGPASSLYGANAFLGVVNIITRDGEGEGGASVTARGGKPGHPGRRFHAGKRHPRHLILFRGDGGL